MNDNLLLIELNEEIIELKKEIERLNKQIEEYQKALDETTSEKVDLHSIIKEVRERLIKPSKFIERIERLKLLEILDKENKE